MRKGKWAINLILLFFSLGFLFPLVIMILTSLKDPGEIQEGNLLGLPHHFNLEAFQNAWQDACIGINCQGLHPYFLNSLIIALPAVLISTFIGSLNGLVLTKWRFKGDNYLFIFFLFGCFIPYQSVIIPLARFLVLINLQNSLIGLILVHVVFGVSFTTLYFRNYYVDLPDELIAAAKMDGANFFNMYRHIILPLSIPIFMVSFIWQFTNIWNDFLFGVTLTSGENQPLMVALNNLVTSSTGVKAYNVDMAASMMAALPTLLIYLLAGKFFLRGLTAGAVKG